MNAPAECNVEWRFADARRDALVALAADPARLSAMPVRDFVDMMVIAP